MVFGRYVYLCCEVFTVDKSEPLSGATETTQPEPLRSTTHADLVNQLLPSLLLLHRDAVPNVRIALAKCLARHFVYLGMSLFVLAQNITFPEHIALLLPKLIA